MSPATARRSAKVVVAIAVAAFFFFLAIKSEVYRETSPPHLAALVLGSFAGDFHPPLHLSLHVAVRKIYSIVAFALVGLAAELALPRSPRPLLRMTVLIAAYSAAIEFGQFLHGSKEGPFWNVFDILCGAAGGWIAARFTPARWQRY